MNWPEFVGYVAALSTIGTYSMRTMIPLRVTGIVSNCLFIAYGFFAGVYPPLVLHCILLPLNAQRLYQMLQLVKKVKQASHGDLSLDWLKPFMKQRSCGKGDILFRKGDVADEMFYSVTGRYRLTESGIELPPGEVIGELGLLAPDRRRTQTLECIADGAILTISYSDVTQLYFQNPKFGFYFLRLTTGRLFQNIERLQQDAKTTIAHP